MVKTELVKAGQLPAVHERAEDPVKGVPCDPASRAYYFKLLAATGELDGPIPGRRSLEVKEC